jgi:hypothetical protein
MRRIKLALVACVSVLAVALSAAPAGAAADPVPPASTSKDFRLDKLGPGVARAWECQPDFSCYFDLTYGRNWLFNAGRCGEHDLMGGIYQNRISSISNRGHGIVWVYTWSSSGWQLKGWIPIGYQGSFFGTLENDIDRIVIDC